MSDTKRIFVTGSTGFIGQHLVRNLFEHGHTVVAASRSAEQKRDLLPEGVLPRNLDVTRPNTFSHAFSDIDAVIHAAAKVGDWGNRERFLATDRDGTEHVIAAAENAGVPTFVHVSSVSTYGFHQQGEVTEDAPIVNNSPWPYMLAKAEAEHVCLRARERGYPVCIVRPGNVYGPGSEPWANRPALAIKKGINSLPAGFGPSNTVYVENVCALLRTCAIDPRAGGETFHVVDDGVIGFDVFFGAYAEALGKKGVPVRPKALLKWVAFLLEIIARLTGNPPLVTRLALDYLCFPGYFTNKKSKRVLGFTPPVSAGEGMARTIAYLNGPNSPLR